jgi:hypothetical protein
MIDFLLKMLTSSVAFSATSRILSISVVSILIDFGYMHVCDWASHAFLPMISCKGCSLAKIQHYSLSSLIRVPHHHFTYDTVLRDFHCERPKRVFMAFFVVDLNASQDHAILFSISNWITCHIIFLASTILLANGHACHFLYHSDYETI